MAARIRPAAGGNGLAPLLLAGCLLAIAVVGPVHAGDPQLERRVAAWALAKGGRVLLHGAQRPLTSAVELPDSELSIHSIDLLGTLISPAELSRLQGLSDLRELTLPGTMWNPVCCGPQGDMDESDELANLAGLTSLESLHLSHHFHSIYKGVSIFDHAIEKISSLVNLTELRLKYTRIQGDSLRPFTKLRWLDLTYTDLNDKGAAVLAGLPLLERLYLRSTYITDEALRHVSGLELLQELDLDSTAITDEGLGRLAGLKRLRKLNLLGAAITDAGLARLTGLQELEELNLYRTRVTNAGLAHLESLPRLRSVDLRYSRVTGAGVSRLQEALPECSIAFLDVAPSISQTPEPPDSAEEARLAEGSARSAAEPRWRGIGCGRSRWPRPRSRTRTWGRWSACADCAA